LSFEPSGLYFCFTNAKDGIIFLFSSGDSFSRLTGKKTFFSYIFFSSATNAASPSSPPVSRLPQRSNRGKPAVRYGFHTNIVKEVSKYGEEGDAALVAELKNMYEKKVFFPVKREKLSPEEKRNIIPSLAFVKQKYYPDGSKDKVKVRRYKQDRSLFVDKNISSPTLHLEHLFTEMAMAQAKKPFRTSLDIGAAYLNVPVEESEVNI
jgi:hypothetical protein